MTYPGLTKETMLFHDGRCIVRLLSGWIPPIDAAKVLTGFLFWVYVRVWPPSAVLQEMGVLTLSLN